MSYAGAVLAALQSTKQNEIYLYFKKRNALSHKNAINPDIKELNKEARVKLTESDFTSSNFIVVDSLRSRMWFDEAKYLNTRKAEKIFLIFLVFGVLLISIYTILSILTLSS